MDFSNVKNWTIPEGNVYRVVDSNNRVIWERSGYFYMEDTSGNTNTLSIIKSNANAPTIEVFVSTNTVDWVSIGSTSTTAITATIPANGKLYIKAEAVRWGIHNSSYYWNTITASGAHNIGGNIMSLLYGDDYLTKFEVGKWVFRSLFSGNTTLVNAENLLLPATTLGSDCYANMFRNCTSLITAPATLPATRTAQECYYYMFYNCTALTKAPNILGTVLALGCFQSMFQGCTALTQAPELPATRLNTVCYGNMFNGCTSLTTAPELPATTLVEQCYAGMFSGCSSLNSVTTYATNISATNCLNVWLNGVSATGDFYNLGGATYTSGASGIPEGWTEHNTL